MYLCSPVVAPTILIGLIKEIDVKSSPDVIVPASVTANLVSHNYSEIQYYSIKCDVLVTNRAETLHLDQFWVCSISPPLSPKLRFFPSLRSAICNPEPSHWIGMPRLTNGGPERSEKRGFGGKRDIVQTQSRSAMPLNSDFPIPWHFPVNFFEFPWYFQLVNYRSLSFIEAKICLKYSERFVFPW